ncbi:histidine kinase/DNA gyrase B/HSP90-like ATPase [Mobilisporobacter senegalensis]|uniref:histidine kinase n=1 Tax=Mobilisporobacter senegalensis TaxID=1329262 RepID=A0A3N1XZB6_9FIRM|nr:ATP-binding protein [Mobilisporobacter senegalensis]ROR31933.1 histidine kinase/DNA gyrase B/HSP90-like ATPase [Mobilisporobacter senegalensis]
MMTELSLNVLDVAQNSIRAKSSLIQITVSINTMQDQLLIEILDNGLGMSKEQLKKVEDPFFTTRTTRSVGLGIPFFKYAAQSTGGVFRIDSDPGKGTSVTAIFSLSHIDRMPLGDMTSTVHTLITFNTDIDFLYSYTVDNKSFILDTREFRKILGDVPFNIPEISEYIKDFLRENQDEVNNGRFF